DPFGRRLLARFRFGERAFLEVLPGALDLGELCFARLLEDVEERRQALLEPLEDRRVRGIDRLIFGPDRLELGQLAPSLDERLFGLAAFLARLRAPIPQLSRAFERFERHGELGLGIFGCLAFEPGACALELAARDREGDLL